MRKLYNIIFSFLLLGCVQDEDFSVPPLECNDPNLSQTITAGDLYKSSSTSPKLYENDDIITAYVVSSDEGGNIYKNISCLLYTSPSPRDVEESRMPSSA